MSNKTPDCDRLWCWVDLETTGLNEHAGSVLEVGLVLTTPTLSEVARWSRVVAFWGPVDPEIARMHGPDGSGLLRADDDGRQWFTPLSVGPQSSALVVQHTAADWLRSHCGDVLPLWCGRNVGFDRRWARVHLPALHDAISHRSIDETTLRIALGAWAGLDVPKDPAAGTRHRALADLDESLRVARALMAGVKR